MFKRSILLLALVLAGATSAFAQATGQISGIVTGNAGQPLAGASVSVAGTNLGAQTGSDGRYVISAVPAGRQTVRITATGYGEQTRAVTVSAGQTATASLQLTQQAVNLEGLVVVGYTTQQRRNVSDAVAGVRSAEIREQQVATLEESLRGRVPGVQIAASGEPGRAAQIIIRGQNFLSNASPLYVVDGMYLRQNPNLNPDEIESIDVLKDASAAAQYGAQAANGVVVIRTRRGRGRETFDLRTYYGFQEVPRTIEMMNTAEWAALTRQAYENAGRTPIAGAVNPPDFDTDWQDALFRRGAIQDHNLAVSGGSERANYMISGGYLRQEGTIVQTDFQRYSFRVNSEARRGRLTLGENVALSSTSRSFLDAHHLAGFPLTNALRFPPAIAVEDPSISSGFGIGSEAIPTFGANPVGTLMMRDNTGESRQVIGTAYAELGLPAGLNYRFNLGVHYEDWDQRDFMRRGLIRFRSPLDPATLRSTRIDNTSLLFENLLTFNRSFGDVHQLNAVAGYTEQRQTIDRLEAYREGFPEEDLRVIDAGQRSNLNNAGTRFENALRAFLLRANYSLMDRYLITGSVRRDGSSRFGPGNRWGTFGALSLGWVVSEESFFQNIPVLGNAAGYFKLRASHGVLGNQDIGDYRFSAPVVQNLNYLFANNVVVPGGTQLGLTNPNIRWQSNEQTNFGVDLGLFEERLTVTADYYVSESDGLLVEAPIPWSLGAVGNPVVNAGSIRNSGFELGLGHRFDRGDFRLNTNLSLTTTRNKVLSLGNGGQPIFAGPSGIARTTVGSPIGTFFVLKTDGIFQSEEEVRQHGAQPNARPGDVRYKDLNGRGPDGQLTGQPDGKITQDDRYEAGSGNPDLSGGLFMDAGFRNFDFGLNLRGSWGAEIYNAARFMTDRMDDLSNFRRGLKPWTEQNPSTTTPRALIGPGAAMNANPLSDRWIEDGSYLRVQNVMLGYRLPSRSMRWTGMGDVQPRIYVNLQNLHTFTEFSNWDPETLGPGDALARGIDDGAIYPNPRTITLGLDLRL